MMAAADQVAGAAAERGGGAGAGSASGTATLGQRLLARVLMLGVSVLQRLPDRAVYRLSHALGVGLSYLMRERRALVRANLGRVCRWLDETGAATPRVQAAARDPRRLDALVRDAFGHWVTSYAESAMAPRYDAATLLARIRLETPDTVRAALAPIAPGEGGRIFVSLHFGSVELAALYAARVGQIASSAIMERVTNPALRGYFERIRGSLGVRVIPPEDAAAVIGDELAGGRAVGIVADRVIGGQGTRVTLFGAPARLPGGPAVLAVETGAPCYVLAVWRSGPGAWIGRVEVLDVETQGTRRDRVRRTLDAQTRAFERLVAAAPEQWWTLFFPIWGTEGS